MSDMYENIDIEELEAYVFSRTCGEEQYVRVLESCEQLYAPGLDLTVEQLVSRVMTETGEPE